MTRVYGIGLAVALSIGAVIMVRNSGHKEPQSALDDSRNASAPFRDGLYAGKFAAEHGAAPHISTGRWAAKQDQELFAAGYKKGYSESVATQPATGGRAPHAE